MEKQYNRVFRTYFSDLFCWCLVVSVLFVITLTAALAFNPASMFIWVIPFLFLIIFSFSTPMFVLYFRTKKDLKAKNIEILSIKIVEIKEDNKHAYKNRGGATVGKRKYKIVDENDNEYLISSSNEKFEWELFYIRPSFSVELEVLMKSRLVLKMKLIDNPKTTNRLNDQKQNIKAFTKLFCQYFY